MSWFVAFSATFLAYSARAWESMDPTDIVFAKRWLWRVPMLLIGERSYWRNSKGWVLPVDSFYRSVFDLLLKNSACLLITSTAIILWFHRRLLYITNTVIQGNSVCGEELSRHHTGVYMTAKKNHHIEYNLEFILNYESPQVQVSGFSGPVASVTRVT